MHEILYPLCQGFDSVEIKADVELGGNDQKFNNLVGRNLMAQYDLEPQIVILSPLLLGTDGKEKMSQSLGNFISVIDTPQDMYGKTMSIPDELMENWFTLCTDVPLDEVADLMAKSKSGELNPRDVKRRLAMEIVELYHSKEAAQEADDYFIKTFSEKQRPVDAEEFVVPTDLVGDDGLIGLSQVVLAAGLAKSGGNAKDLMKAGAVSLDDEKITNVGQRFALGDLQGKLLRVGKVQFRRLA
jgi:tyrosyl-tRNA synthetase